MSEPEIEENCETYYDEQYREDEASDLEETENKWEETNDFSAGALTIEALSAQVMSTAFATLEAFDQQDTLDLSQLPISKPGRHHDLKMLLAEKFDILNQRTDHAIAVAIHERLKQQSL